eukprot:1279941-Prorocentrum_lima.AAC.1
MTSSLVGSEMCIRDRLKEGDGQLLKAFSHAGTRLNMTNTSYDDMDVKYCLLYTSDAADDM